MTESDGLPSVTIALSDGHDDDRTRAPANQDWRCGLCSEKAARWLDGQPVCHWCFWEHRSGPMAPPWWH